VSSEVRWLRMTSRCLDQRTDGFAPHRQKSRMLPVALKVTRVQVNDDVAPWKSLARPPAVVFSAQCEAGCSP
jgi:hypothetical protein